MAGSARLHGRVWTVAEVAEDLVAQVEGALTERWTEEEIIESLGIEGLDSLSVRQLLDDVRGQIGSDGPVQPDGQAPVACLSLVPLRTLVREDSDALSIDTDACEQVIEALVAQGLRSTTAQAIVNEVVGMERRSADVYQRRMRRLGVQGMAFGGCITLFFLYGVVVGGPSARWHLVTASLTLALFVYSVFLYRRGRPPGKK